MRCGGPSAVTYRKTAEVAGAAPSSVGYYFDSIDSLIEEATAFNMKLWLDLAEDVAQYAESISQDECYDRLVELIIKVILPDSFENINAHYLQILDASNHQSVAARYRRGRLMVDEVVARIASHAGLKIDNPRMISMIVDGAAILAIAEGSSVRNASRRALNEAFAYALSNRHVVR